MVLTSMADPRDRDRPKVVMACDHTPHTQFRLFPGGKYVNPRSMRQLMAYGLIAPTSEGPVGLPCYSITSEGRKAVELHYIPPRKKA